jgi:UDP-N-acetylglucosamine transferase subunit ALG13
MIFLTVGTELPFDRLVQAVDEIAGRGVLGEEWFAQIGDSRYKPLHLPWVASMEGHHFDQRLCECNAIISHAGIGTILKAVQLQKPVLVMPRLRRYGEHVNDHQLATARKFEMQGKILVAYSPGELLLRLEQLHAFRSSAQMDGAERMAECIHQFLSGLEEDAAD